MKTNIKLNLLVFTIILASCAESNQKTKDMKNEKPKEIKVINDGIIIDYNVCGEGDTTLLFVHGWCINKEYWSNQIEVFCTDYKVVTIDLPGFRNSGKNRDDWTIEDFGKDVHTVIDALDLKNVVLIGHSMGGNIVLEAALNNKNVIALVGVDNFKYVSLQPNVEMKKETDALIQMLKENFKTTVEKFMVGYLFHPSTEELVKKRVLNDFLAADSSAAISALGNYYKYFEKQAVSLTKLKRKLYLINSDALPSNEEGLKSTGVNFEIFDINATGHYPMIEKPKEFNTQLKAVLEKIKTE